MSKSSAGYAENVVDITQLGFSGVSMEERVPVGEMKIMFTLEQEKGEVDQKG